MQAVLGSQAMDAGQVDQPEEELAETPGRG
jgi:hypothetical protein